MRRTALFVTVLVGLTLALPVLAQEGGNIGQVFFVEPKLDELAEFEAKYKEHVKWHADQKDAWGWPAWEIVSGERMGQFAVGTFQHSWKDIDRGEFGAQDRTHAVEGFLEHAEGLTVEFWDYMPAMSRPPEETGPAHGVVNYTHVEPGMMDQYQREVGKILHALAEKGWSRHSYTAALVASGENGTMVRWSPRSDWADFESSDPPLMSVMEAVYGVDEARSIMDSLTSTIHCSRSEIWAFRPDLSYVPGQ